MAAQPAPPRPHPTAWVMVLVLVAAGATACLAGCSSTTPPPHTALTVSPPPSARSPAAVPHPAFWPKGVPDPATVDGSDPTAVSRSALTIMWTINYGADHHGQHDAQLRALPLLTPAYAAHVRTAPPGRPPPDAWIRDHARTRLQLRPGEEERPADSATTAYRQWLLTITTLDGAGHRITRAHITAYLILTRSPNQPWRVAQASTY